VAGFEAWPGVEVATTLQAALRGADAVMTLRVQLERDATSGPALTDYVRDWRLDDERLTLAAPGAPILHPGPTNEGCEITAELANGPRSLIGRQVENGVPVRMAVLAALAGAA
jgi:aspartate carbamoyltransferase catalytic subunit